MTGIGIYKAFVSHFEEDAPWGLVEENILVIADTNRDAIEKIISYYGDDNIDRLHIDLVIWTEDGILSPEESSGDWEELATAIEKFRVNAHISEVSHTP